MLKLSTMWMSGEKKNKDYVLLDVNITFSSTVVINNRRAKQTLN